MEDKIEELLKNIHQSAQFTDKYYYGIPVNDVEIIDYVKQYTIQVLDEYEEWRIHRSPYTPGLVKEFIKETSNEI